MQTKMQHALIFKNTLDINKLRLITYLLFQFVVHVKYSL